MKLGENVNEFIPDKSDDVSAVVCLTPVNCRSQLCPGPGLAFGGGGGLSKI